MLGRTVARRTALAEEVISVLVKICLRLSMARKKGALVPVAKVGDTATSAAASGALPSHYLVLKTLVIHHCQTLA